MKAGTGFFLALAAAEGLVIASLVVVVEALPPPIRISDVLARAAAEREKAEDEAELMLRTGSSWSWPSLSEKEGGDQDVTVSFVDQRLDHFGDDDSEELSFRQRYFYSPLYVHSTTAETQGTPDDAIVVGDGPRPTAAFLCVGGEGPALDVSVLTDSVHCTGDMLGLARTLHDEEGWDVHIFALEHRYYGESFPEGSVENGDLTYLSSRQAVRDVVEFVKDETIRTILGVDDDDDVPWITFGGSYPGMLSTWSRLLYPDVIYGAVSNSAPVQAQLDFGGYNDRVGKDLADADVGGSEECRKIVVDGHAQVVDLLELGGGDGLEKLRREKLAKLFDVCGGAGALADARNVDAFVGAGLITIPAQGNDPSCKGTICNIKDLCDTMVGEQRTNPKKLAMEILATISEKQQGNQCMGVDFDSFVEYLLTPTVFNANMRSWFYQTCTEFGFYQTCNDGSECPYGRGYHGVSQDLQQCKAIFGIEPDDVRNAVQSTLEYYGGWDLSPHISGEEKSKWKRFWDIIRHGGGDKEESNGQKRIIFVNGDVDPWSELAVTGRRGSTDHPSVLVQGASHHFWTHKEKDSDGEAVVDARKEIYTTVARWLGVENFSPDLNDVGSSAKSE